MGDRLEGFKPRGGCCCLIIIDAIPLREALSNVADLVTHHFTSIVTLALADELASQRALASQNLGPRDKYKDLQLLKAVDLILGAGNPVLPFGGCHGLGPQWVVINIHFWI